MTSVPEFQPFFSSPDQPYGARLGSLFADSSRQSVLLEVLNSSVSDASYTLILLSLIVDGLRNLQ